MSEYYLRIDSLDVLPTGTYFIHTGRAAISYVNYPVPNGGTNGGGGGGGGGGQPPPDGGSGGGRPPADGGSGQPPADGGDGGGDHPPPDPSSAVPSQDATSRTPPRSSSGPGIKTSPCESIGLLEKVVREGANGAAHSEYQAVTAAAAAAESAKSAIKARNDMAQGISELMDHIDRTHERYTSLLDSFARNRETPRRAPPRSPIITRSFRKEEWTQRNFSQPPSSPSPGPYEEAGPSREGSERDQTPSCYAGEPEQPAQKRIRSEARKSRSE